MRQTYDLILKGGAVVDHNGVGERDIGIRGGKTAFIGGVALNKGVARSLASIFELEEQDFFIPKEGVHVAAIGAAITTGVIFATSAEAPHVIAAPVENGVGGSVSYIGRF